MDTIINIVEEITSLLTIEDSVGVITNLNVIGGSISVIEVSRQGVPGKDGIQGIPGLKGDTPSLDGIETIIGSQAKADLAKSDSKNYTDNRIQETNNLAIAYAIALG